MCRRQERGVEMSLEDLMREIDEALEISKRISNNLRIAEEKNQAYAQNRRTSPFPGAVIANAAIA